jgi:hypothetical protein
MPIPGLSAARAQPRGRAEDNRPLCRLDLSKHPLAVITEGCARGSNTYTHSSKDYLMFLSREGEYAKTTNE